MFPTFKAISILHPNLPSHLREIAAFDESACRSLLRYLGYQLGLTNVLVLTTGTRTEVYYCSPADQTQVIAEALFQQKQLTGSFLNTGTLPEELFTVINNPKQAVQHLYQVSAGLASRRTGDEQVYQQVKQAFDRSLQEGLAGVFLRRLMRNILLLRGLRWN
jgi:glutamyl-tRNA reductase